MNKKQREGRFTHGIGITTIAMTLFTGDGFIAFCALGYILCVILNWVDTGSWTEWE